MKKKCLFSLSETTVEQLDHLVEATMSPSKSATLEEIIDNAYRALKRGADA